MLLFTLIFLATATYVQTLSVLPSSLLLYITIATSILCWFKLKTRTPYAHLPFAFALGLSWTTWYASSLLEWQLPHNCEGQPVIITGYIASLPVTDKWQQSAIFKLTSLQCPNKTITQATHIRLSWRDKQHLLKVGDQWQFQAKLKRIHSTQNPGAFDFEAWAIQKGLRASGYVLPNSQAIFLSHSYYRYPIDQCRQWLQTNITKHLPNSSTSHWLLALMIGERNGIPQEDWQVLRNTGTNHLMAIGGLHIGIIAGMVYLLVCKCVRLFPRIMLWLPAPLIGTSAALMIALIYSALAGFSIPTQRACIMLMVFSAAVLLKRKINPWHAWSFALLLVLFLNPLTVLSESFWLSFGTIALIIYGMRGRYAPSGFWWKWGRVQWVIGVGLIPLSLQLFHECSLVSFAANCIAIPWLEFFILPFCLFSMLFLFIYPNGSTFFLMLADKSLAGLWAVLTWFSQLHLASWTQVIPNHWIYFSTIIAFILCLSPKSLPGKWLGIVWLLPLLLYRYEKPAPGDVWMTLLDVGQGLSVVVQTHSHLLVFDAGPKWNANVDMGESVVLPYLYTLGAKKIDMLVISHGDNDHIGGAQALMRALPISAIRTSEPDLLPSTHTNYCLAGHSWEWDKVRFSFIYPSMDQLANGNDSSCVLRIEKKDQQILLTGDIEKLAEKNLLEHSSPLLAATVLVAPHHGSKTSGLKAFVQAVHPDYVLYATGYRNRYRFPHPSVVKTYEEIGSQPFNTAMTGAVRLKLEHTVMKPEIYRVLHKRYWMDH